MKKSLSKIILSFLLIISLHFSLFAQQLTVDVLVVSGGGSGGAGYGGGGGGGAVKYFTSQTVSGATTVIVGAGGAAVNITTNGTTVSGNPGESSSFGTLEAFSLFTANGPNSAGGGGGGAGSGGGAGGNFNTTAISGGRAVTGMGNNGGGSKGNGANFSNVCGGGGGGAGAVGGSGGTTTIPPNRGGVGGAGISNSISGVAVFYGGGGGGGVTFNGNAGGAGGNGGGGAGSKGDVAATNGTANTGGGGGGFGASNGGASNKYSGAGGSGVVIVRYLGNTILATGGVITQAGGYTIHTFNTSGTFALPCNANTGDTTASACGSFVWYGVTYTSSATPTRTFTNVGGCDSVVTLHLTINNANTGDTTASACGSFVWYGVTYNASATPTHTFTNVGGCDSVVTLHLTITTPPAQPTLACYETASFNSNTCSWDVTGTQPEMPTIACYESANFNTGTCSWDVTGTQLAMSTVALTSNTTQICNGSSVTFTATANFNPMDYNWDPFGTEWEVSHDGGASFTNIPGQYQSTFTTSSLLNNDVVRSQSRYFNIDNGCEFEIFSSQIQVQVNSSPKADINIISASTSGSIKFDGSNQYLTLSNSPNYGTGAFTIDGWFRLDAPPTNVVPIIGAEGYGNPSVLIQSNLNTIVIDVYQDHGDFFTVPTITLGAWHHLVVVRNSSSDVTVFLDGQRSSTGSITESFSFASTANANVGKFQGNFLNGFLSNLRIVTGSALYDPTQTTITVPTSLTTVVANTNLLLNAINASSLLIDASGTQSSITNNGDASWSGGSPFVVNLNSSSNATISNATVGGAWSSSDNSILQVNTSGQLSPIATGNATITYTVTSNTPFTCVSTESTLLSVTINTQNFFTRCNATWSKQNLNVTTYNDGTTIPQVTDFSTLYSMQTGAWMYYNNIPSSNKLYNWYAVAGIYDAQSLSNPTLRKQIAPTGWRVPTDSEWNKLTKCFDANADTSCLNCNASANAADSLINLGLINAYLGSCDFNGCANDNLWQNYWTSSSYDNAYALARYVNKDETNLQRYIQNAEKYHGFSVPLIQDLTSTGDTTATACGSFVWYGQTYTTSGTPTHTFTNANGYDSVVTLHLTINTLPTPTFTSSPSTTCLNTDVTYTTQSGQASYSWRVAGTAGVDYSITSGGLSSSSNSVILKWLTAGSKNVSVNYTDQNGCTGGGIDIPTNGLVGYWPFTGNANDATAGGHNGDLRGTTLPALITDRHGNSNSAYAFTAGGTIPNHIYVGRNVLSNFSQMAVSLWFKTSSTTTSLPLSSGNNNEYNIQINPNGKILTGTYHCNNGTVTNGGYVYTESSDAYNDNSWHHVVLVYDGSYNKLYVDGVFNSQVQNTSGTTTPGCASNANYSDLSFSSYYLYGDYYPLSSTEDLDDIAIYNRALSANEVADLYNAQNSEIIGGAMSTTVVSIANTGDTTASACGSFVWYGVKYTSSATPTHTFKNMNGCDSVVTLHLTINTPTSSTDTVAACVSYVWNGVTYTTSGTRTWNGTNVAGCDSTAILNLTISTSNVYPPFGVTQTVISNVCSARVYRYTASVRAAGTTYNWILPTSIGGVSGVTVDSGDINSSRTLLVRYASNEAAFATDVIKVRSFNGCASNYTAVKLNNIKLAVPNAPGFITVTNIGANNCSNRTYRFTAPSLPAGTNSSNSTILPATEYLWSLIGNLSEYATIDSGDENSQKIVVSFSSNIAATIGDSIKLQYLSSCGNSLPKALKLSNTKLNVPLAPATITITALQTNVCGARRYRYTAPNLTASSTTYGAATGYVWSLVGSLSGTATVDSGDINSRVIAVTFSSNASAATGDSIRLYYTSDCGNGARKASKLTNTLLGAPSAPATITIQTKSDVCNARTYRYIAPAVLPVATTTIAAASGYLWSAPTGNAGSTGTIDSGEVNSRIITVTYSSNAAAGVGDSIRLRYTSGCGNGAIKAQKLSNLVKNGCTPIAKNVSTSRTSKSLPTSFEVNVYPNPTTNQFNVQVKSAGTEEVVVRVLDLTGRFIKSIKVSSNSNLSLGSDLKAGAYMLEVKQSKEVKMVRVVKF